MKKNCDKKVINVINIIKNHKKNKIYLCKIKFRRSSPAQNKMNQMMTKITA